MHYRFPNKQMALDFYTKYYPKYEVKLEDRYVEIVDRELMTPASRMGGTLERKSKGNEQRRVNPGILESC